MDATFTSKLYHHSLLLLDPSSSGRNIPNLWKGLTANISMCSMCPRRRRRGACFLLGTHALAFGISFTAYTLARRLYIAQILLIKKYNDVNIYCRMEHLSEDILEEWAELLKALAHPIRLRILATLIEGRQCVKNLTELLKISQPNVSQHLGILRNKGIVGCKRDGSVVCYYIKDERALKIYEILSKEVTKWQETSSH
jgi:ArsR family transcriptional regulator